MLVTRTCKRLTLFPSGSILPWSPPSQSLAYAGDVTMTQLATFRKFNGQGFYVWRWEIAAAAAGVSAAPTYSAAGSSVRAAAPITKHCRVVVDTSSEIVQLWQADLQKTREFKRSISLLSQWWLKYCALKSRIYWVPSSRCEAAAGIWRQLRFFPSNNLVQIELSLYHTQSPISITSCDLSYTVVHTIPSLIAIVKKKHCQRHNGPRVLSP